MGKKFSNWADSFRKTFFQLKWKVMIIHFERSNSLTANSLFGNLRSLELAYSAEDAYSRSAYGYLAEINT